MRRRITLLVAATTSIVLLAFLLPAASLVTRVAEARALDAAQAQVQFLTPSVGLDDRDQVSASLVGTSNALPSAVRWTDATWIGDPPDRDIDVPASAEQIRSDAGTLLLQPVSREGGTAVIEVFVPAAQLREGVTRTWLVLAGLGLILLVLALLVADRLARSLTRPVSELAATARRLGTGDLTARAEPAGPPEVRAVGEEVNRLAGRIGELLAAERESAADLAHRLRTPLTALRLDAESLPAAQRERIVDGVDAVSRGVDEVIREARRPLREGLGTGCDATAVVVDRAHFWSVLAVDEGRELRIEGPEEPLPVRVSAEDLAAAVDALLGNVFAHTPEGSGMLVEIRRRDGGGAVLRVGDDGPGVPEGAVARGRSGGGSTGLGLDIVRRTAEASGGALALSSSSAGTQVTVELGPP
ncbi:MAG: sensor histidine kinase [Blastococcus sp.]|nr:sensor histidine kinase [Blastococcus sp.]